VAVTALAVEKSFLSVAVTPLPPAGFNLPDGKSHLPVARLVLQIAGRPLPDAGRRLSVGLLHLPTAKRHLPVGLSPRAVDF
jgi:hypothetical protein